MGWIVKQADVHKCEKPKSAHNDGVRTGDVWQCDTCGRQWKVTVESDPRDSWFVWDLWSEGGGLIKP